jgi:hypothetical protein
MDTVSSVLVSDVRGQRKRIEPNRAESRGILVERTIHYPFHLLSMTGAGRE